MKKPTNNSRKVVLRIQRMMKMKGGNMQRLKCRSEIANQTYLTKSDIKKLMDISMPSAKRIYQFADSIDQGMKYRIEPRKVRITSVCAVVGMSLATLKKQATDAS